MSLLFLFFLTLPLSNLCTRSCQCACTRVSTNQSPLTRLGLAGKKKKKLRGMVRDSSVTVGPSVSSATDNCENPTDARRLRSCGLSPSYISTPAALKRRCGSRVVWKHTRTRTRTDTRHQPLTQTWSQCSEDAGRARGARSSWTWTQAEAGEPWQRGTSAAALR